MANQEQKNILAKNLKLQLDKKGISQTEFAKILNYPEMTVSNWINAKFYPRIDKIQEIADYFNINKSDLIEDKSSTAEPELPTHFTTPQEAMNFLLNQQVVMGFNGLDITKLSEEDQITYANEVLNMMQLVSLKYKDKK